MFADRVLSGMRPTGSLHLGHYHGVLKNWITLQQQYECLFSSQTGTPSPHITIRPN